MPKLSLILLGIISFFLVAGHSLVNSFQQDKQCVATHTSSSVPPAKLVTANDFFEQGNYDYETGNCTKAVEDYSQALKFNPKYAEAFNNRAYTYMRMQQFQNALPDLDSALTIRPNYVNALMNRGDIYNFYYNIDRQKALMDYDKVLAQGESAYRNTSLCGHRLLAQNNGWTLETFSRLMSGGLNAGCQ